MLLNIEGGGAGGGGSAAPVPDANAAADAAQAGAGAAAAPPSAEVPAWAKVWIDQAAALRAELIDMRRENRNKGAQAQGQAAAAPPPDVATQLAELRQQVASSHKTNMLRDALDATGLTLNPAQRGVLSKLYDGAGEVGDLAAWVSEQAGALGWGKTAAAPGGTPARTAPQSTAQPATAAPPPAVAAPPPTGTQSGSVVIPDDPSQIPQSVIDQWKRDPDGPKKVREHFERWKRQSGQFVHPFSAAREAEKKAAQDAARTADAVRQLLAAGDPQKR